MPELEATAPAIPFWFYRVVAGAAELGGWLRQQGARNNTARARLYHSLPMRSAPASLEVPNGLKADVAGKVIRKTVACARAILSPDLRRGFGR